MNEQFVPAKAAALSTRELTSRKRPGSGLRRRTATWKRILLMLFAWFPGPIFWPSSFGWFFSASMATFFLQFHIIINLLTLCQLYAIIFLAGQERRPHTRQWRNWQTRKIQVLVPVRVWRFKSSLPHQYKIRGVFFRNGKNIPLIFLLRNPRDLFLVRFDRHLSTP